MKVKELFAKRQDSRQAGFTLVELLVVISIIGVLAVITILALGRARQKARDVKRISDIRTAYTAISIFYESNGYYPGCNDPGYEGGCDHTGFILMPGSYFDSTLDGAFLTFLAPQLSSPLRDPINSPDYYYMYGSNAEYPAGSGNFYDFGVAARLEDINNQALKYSLGGFPGVSEYFMLGEKRSN